MSPFGWSTQRSSSTTFAAGNTCCCCTVCNKMQELLILVSSCFRAAQAVPRHHNAHTRPWRGEHWISPELCRLRSAATAMHQPRKRCFRRLLQHDLPARHVDYNSPDAQMLLSSAPEHVRLYSAQMLKTLPCLIQDAMPPLAQPGGTHAQNGRTYMLGCTGLRSDSHRQCAINKSMLMYSIEVYSGPKSVKDGQQWLSAVPSSESVTGTVCLAVHLSFHAAGIRDMLSSMLGFIVHLCEQGQAWSLI